MALYNRDYVKSTAGSLGSGTSHTQEDLQEGILEGDRSSIVYFLKQTYQLFAGSLLAASVGAYVGMGYAEAISSWYWGIVVLEFVLLFGIYAFKSKPGINLILLFAFTFMTGLTLTPLFSSILGMPNGASIVFNAFATTTVVFGALSFYAMSTSRDFTSMSKPLFIALIVVVVASVINIFLGNPILQTIIAAAGALLFSVFIIFDTQNIIKGAFSTPVEAALALYLDFLNLFVSLLQLFGIFSSEE